MMPPAYSIPRPNRGPRRIESGLSRYIRTEYGGASIQVLGGTWQWDEAGYLRALKRISSGVASSVTGAAKMLASLLL